MWERRNRPLDPILIAVVDGLKGRSYKRASCTLIRNSLELISWKDRKSILPSIKAIYRAKRRYSLHRCRYEGYVGMNRWVRLGVIADNVVNIGRLMEKQAPA